MYLVFDTETTGLPRNWNAPITDISNWPRMIQIAWLLFDKHENIIEAENYIVKPQGFTIPYEAEKLHGISTSMALQNGEELKFVLKKFLKVLNSAEYLIAHNIEFDEKIVGAEFIRENIKINRLFNIKKICTKELGTNYCQLPGRYGSYKWPTLSELYFKLFNEKFQEAHYAETDVKACARCFFELKRKGIINI